MKMKNNCCLVFSLLLLFFSFIQAYKFGILFSDYDGYITDVEKKLLPLLDDLAFINVQTSNPTPSQLNLLDAILVYSNFGFKDSVVLGNLLADYIDTGTLLVCFCVNFCPLFVILILIIFNFLKYHKEGGCPCNVLADDILQQQISCLKNYEPSN